MRAVSSRPKLLPVVLTSLADGFSLGTFSEFVEFDAIELIAWFLYQRLVTTLSVARRVPIGVLCPFTSIGLVTEANFEFARYIRKERA